jgi:hypothetical protein
MQTRRVDPIVSADEGMLAPARVIRRRQASALEVIETVHSEHQPLFTLAHEAVKQVNIGNFVRLEAAHRVQFRCRGLKERLLLIVLFQLGTQLGNRLIKLACRSIDIPGHVTFGNLLHCLQRDLFVELGYCGCVRTHVYPS